MPGMRIIYYSPSDYQDRIVCFGSLHILLAIPDEKHEIFY